MLLLLLFRCDILWFCRDEGGFFRARDELDGDVPESRKENALSDIGIEQDVLLPIREVEELLEAVDRGRGLFHEDLDGGVCDDGAAVRRFHEIIDVLRNGGHAEEVLPRALDDAVEEARGILVLHEVPRFVHHEDALLEF